MSIDNATINGIYYSPGVTFAACTNFVGKSASDGSGRNSTIIAGSVYCFVKYNPGARYPYAIGTGGSTTVRCWVQASVFPYATYGIYYNANGGGGAPGAQIKTYGANIMLSGTIPSRTGYAFKGWSTSPGGSAVYGAGSIYTANAGVTLYAVWQANTYSVVFHVNGGMGSMGNQPMTYDSSKALSPNMFYRTGYTFKGWATNRSGSVVYEDAATVKNLTSAAGGIYILYAVWEANSYTVTYDAVTNGGVGNTTVTKTYGSALGILPVANKRHYIFLGWYTEASGGRKVTENTRVIGNLKLYAQYAIDASVHIFVKEELKAGFPYVFSNGKWRKGYYYVDKDDRWQQGLSE